MMINKIQSAHWSLDPNGDIYQDLKDIEESFANIFRTEIGSDILRPDFGCNWHQYIDYPVDEVPIHIIREMMIASKKWEPRVEITLINPRVDIEHVTLRITYKLKDAIAGSLKGIKHIATIGAGS